MFVSFIKQNHQSIFKRKLLKLSTKSIQCNFSTEKQTRQFPKCVYVQPPSQWLMTKLNFQRLKAWDGTFDEQEFKRGAKQVKSTKMRNLKFLNLIFSLGSNHAFRHYSTS